MVNWEIEIENHEANNRIMRQILDLYALGRMC